MALAISLPLSNAEPTHAKNSVTKVVSFGDSLTDMGNFYRATGVPPFPYWEGRVSDGPLWIEHLAAKLKITIDPADQYGWLGSMTGNTNFRDIPEAGIYFPGFEQQIETFLEDVGSDGADPRALYSVWIGANDVFDWLGKQNQTPDELITTGVANTVQGIISLSNAGAKHFIVGNLPDLGITPDAQDLGPFVAGLLSQLSCAYNAALEEQLKALEATMGICITRLDAFAIIEQVASEPESFGLTNVTDRAIASYPLSDPSEYLFWDGVHPTTAANEWVADFVCAALVETYSKKKSDSKGRAPLQSLNGLVRAASARN
ncbi:MAG: SGNH/GDSL hydrolase family protein [Akkermansiaceae bacterium]